MKLRFMGKGIIMGRKRAKEYRGIDGRSVKSECIRKCRGTEKPLKQVKNS